MLLDDAYYLDQEEKLELMKSSVSSDETLYFYGAGLRSEEILQMQKEGFDFLRRPDAFLVSTRKSNAHSNGEYLDDIYIYAMDEDEIEDIDKNANIVVIAMDIYHDEIRKSLKTINCRNVFFLTDAMEHILTREFLEFYFEKHGLQAEFSPFVQDYKLDSKGYEDKIHTYSVMCEKDAQLTNVFESVPWISNLQAGAAIAQNQIADLRDDQGENISSKNRYYNELTGLYWVWKNTNYPFSGICHYRRRFESEIALKPILEDKADVVLPLPFVIGGSLKQYYQHWGENAYYEEMLDVVKECFPEYYEVACWCASHIVFIPNNICIARRDILEDYCSFLFGVIDKVEDRMFTYDGKKQTRCWLSEHVTTIYFMKHLKDYRIVFSNLKRCW